MLKRPRLVIRGGRAVPDEASESPHSSPGQSPRAADPRRYVSLPDARYADRTMFVFAYRRHSDTLETLAAFESLNSISEFSASVKISAIDSCEMLRAFHQHQ